MFNLFKRKSEVEKLQEAYKKIMEDAFKLQSINRSESDKKYLEAENILKKIEKLKIKNETI
ncbi:Lacal_2735 family protein [Polaribacter ponticola]|uniref:Lacal_2735 family protein n=1 Tax=Polaribacter ponticola TaxID=2978475 RepID=A0ABT5S5G5_9FLAO|nr:Lacal_2735 family protein [Polaribacter sp. MSW5]MDD7913348.1 Lacal_2735 family protein [Polaribacter sp. MSW5]